MKPKKRQKLCHNCEGEIDLDVIVCPFCAADLREEKPEQGHPSFHTAHLINERQTSHSLYPQSFTKKAVEDPLYEQRAETPTPQTEMSEDKLKNVFSATILFTLGVQLVLLGLLMLFFSHKGAVVLKWNAAHWFLYCLGGMPLLYFGYRAISRL